VQATSIFMLPRTHITSNGRVVFYVSELKHVGRQHDDDGQNKFLQINDSKENLSYIIIRMNLIQYEKLNIGFMFGKNSTEPNFKLHLLRLEMQALYKRRENL
jgi:hypothetical protein